MNQGIAISTSGVLTSLHRQDVLTSNLANLNTVGYKPSVPDVRQRDAAREEDGLWHLPSDEMLELLGAGVVPAPTRVSFSQGAVETTGNPFDLAIDGDGFLAVRTGDGRTSLTRDGRLTIDAAGRLVLATNGAAVLDASGAPITLPPGGAVQIGSDGTIGVDGVPAGALRFVDVADRSSLIKGPSGLFETDGVPESAFRPATGRIVQGAVEQSSVNEIQALMEVQAASRAVSSNVGMIAYHDQMTERAINTFARTA